MTALRILHRHHYRKGVENPFQKRRLPRQRQVSLLALGDVFQRPDYDRGFGRDFDPARMVVHPSHTCVLALEPVFEVD